MDGLTKILNLAVGITLSCSATAALADDWSLSCHYPAAGLTLLAAYDADGPTYSLTVQKPGKVEIPRTKQDAFVITGQNDLFLFTHNAEPNALQLLWRINKVPMTSTLEIGSAVSWDRQSLKGQCRQL